MVRPYCCATTKKKPVINPRMKRYLLSAACCAFLMAGAACSDDPKLSDEDGTENPSTPETPDEPGEGDRPGDKPDRSHVVAFPGAHGAGRFATGGAEGKVCVVNSLEDDGSEGTLRWAVEQKGARTVVFAVSGIINLTKELKIQNGDLTIAGQTAPGDGICLRYYPVNISADNVIIRFMRFRMGDDKLTEKEAEGADALNAYKKFCKNILIDHCSISWSTDECASFYDNVDFTMQWCIISESLRYSKHPKNCHGYGGVWGGQKASFHHNLFAHHDSRTPRLGGSRTSGQPELEMVDLRNNVTYNWGSGPGPYAGEGGSYNFVNNYYKPGPATKSGTIDRIFSPNGDDGTLVGKKGTWGVFHLSGNVFDGSAIDSKYQTRIDAVNADNWLGLQPETKNGIPLPGNGTKEDIQSATEFRISTDAAEYTQSARDAYEWVLKSAGASLKRDAVDERIISEVREGTYHFTGGNTPTGEKTYPGLIDRVSDTDGWPEYSGTPLKDTDHDGMPDSWEREKGLDPNKDDSALYGLSKEYTNLEVYMNGLVEALYPAK